MSLQVWLPLNKDPNMTPEITSYRKESGVTLTEDTDGWYKVQDTIHGANGRWGIYYDFAVKPNTIYTLYVYSKSTTETKASIGMQSFAVVAWPAVRDTNTTSDEKLTTYSWTTGPSDSIARVYLALMTTSTKDNDYVFYKEPRIYEAPQNQGLSNIDFTINTGAIINNSGKIGKCYSFDGVDDWIQGTHDKTMWSGKPITMACWFKSNGDNGGIIIDIAADLCLGFVTINSGIAFRFWRCYSTSSGTRTGHGFNTTTIYDADQWHHIVNVFDGGVTKIYVDGTLSQEWDYSDRYSYWEPLLNSSYNKISIGKSAGDSNWIGGLVNDVRIYDHALSDEEIKQIAQGLVLHYPLNNNGFGNENLATCATDQYNIPFNASNFHYFWINSGTLEPNTTYTFSAEVEVIESMDYCTIFNYSPGDYTGTQCNTFPTDGKRHSWTFTTSETAVGLIGYAGIAGRDANHSAIYKNIKIEKGSKATSYIPRSNENLYTKMAINNNIVYDISGFQNNGTITGTLSTSDDTVRYNVATYFNGSSYILTDSGTFSWFDFDQCTIAAWFKSTVKPSSYSGSIGIAHNQNAAHKYFAISNYGGTFVANSINGSTYINTTSGYVLPLNEWHHCAATLDRTVVKIYVDGVLKNTATINWNNAGIASDTRVNVGVDLPGTDEKYTGYYSDVRIYTTALSASDVQELYKMGREVN